MSDYSIGIPNVLNPIPTISSVPGILAIPNISRILNVPSLTAMQSIPGILGIVKAASTGQIPQLPGIGALLNVSSIGMLVRIPGVSNLLNFSSLTNGLMKGDGLGATKRGQVLPFWGILFQGKPVLQADTVISFDFRNSYRISTFPQEQGAFQSYNKVQSPFESRLTFTRGGTESDRAQFLQAIDDIAASLDLYDVVTPERVYHDANVYDYNLVRRATSGVGLISVEVLLEEVRVTATTQFSGGTAAAAPVAPANPLSPILDLSSGGISLVGKALPGIVGLPSSLSGFSPASLGNLQGLIPSPSQVTNFALNKVGGIGGGLVNRIIG